MAIDPTVIQTSAQGRDADRLADIERRLSAIERGPAVQIQAGAPSAAVRDGALIGDTTNVRLWLRLNGVWRYTTLT